MSALSIQYTIIYEDIISSLYVGAYFESGVEFSRLAFETLRES